MHGLLGFQAPVFDARVPLTWYAGAVTTLLIGGLLGLGYQFVISGMRTALIRERELNGELEAESAARGEALERLAAAQDEMMRRERLEVVGEVAAGLAHDLNNVLTAILGEAELSRDPVSGEAIATSAMHAAGITRRLLGMARPQPSQRRAIRLERALADILPALRRLVPGRIELINHLHRDPQVVIADPTELQQLLINLVLNARDAMPVGGTLTIETQPIDATDEAQLRVVDTGVGIPPELLARVFEPFFTTKGHGRGTGLGLHNIDRIVEAMGGTITVDSVPGQGTSFAIRIARSELPPQDQRTGAAPRGHGESVLVVEDDIAVRAVLVALLDRAGFAVIEARDVDDALRCLAGRPHLDLLVTDLVMPGRSGTALLEPLRQCHDRVPVLFYSGYADPEQLSDVLRSPLTRHLSKPASEDELLTAIAELLHAASDTAAS